MDIRSLALVAVTSAVFGFGGAYAAVAINSPSAGERGPAGPAGPQGVTGPQGPAGEPVSLGPGLGTTDNLATVLGTIIDRLDAQELRSLTVKPPQPTFELPCQDVTVVTPTGVGFYHPTQQDLANLTTRSICVQAR